MDDAPDPRRSRMRVTVGSVIVLALVGLGCAVLVSALAGHGTTGEVARPAPTASPGPVGGSIYVHVLGAVNAPGLYELADGDRAIDAVAAAGGFRDDADQAQLNLARFVVDGEQIAVPALGEVPAAAPGATADGKVNLNTADAAALDTLPRVGPAMAARIVEWREANGSFTSVEDLRNVTGIGDKTFEQLAPLVTV